VQTLLQVLIFSTIGLRSVRKTRAFVFGFIAEGAEAFNALSLARAGGPQEPAAPKPGSVSGRIALTVPRVNLQLGFLAPLRSKAGRLTYVQSLRSGKPEQFAYRAAFLFSLGTEFQGEREERL
jgi:hypothetical protein